MLQFSTHLKGVLIIAMLDPRAEQILEAIVRLFIEQMEPVGSRALAKLKSMNYSAATIRNVMSDLTDLGLISQPHTSAGRVPTDQGYRYYVDKLTSSCSLTAHFTPCKNEPAIKASRLEDLLIEMAEELTAATNCTGVVLSPQSHVSKFKQIDFISLSASQVLVVLVTQTGLVKHRILKLRECPPQESLSKMALILMDLFAQKTLAEIRQSLLNTLSENDQGLSAQAIRLGKKAFNLEKENNSLFITGESRICGYPDFTTHSELSRIYQMLEEKQSLSNLMHQMAQKEGVQVAIGQENHLAGLENCSIVAQAYGRHGYRLGSVGIIGPTRLDYPKVMAALDYTSQKLTHVVSHFIEEKIKPLSRY